MLNMVKSSLNKSGASIALGYSYSDISDITPEAGTAGFSRHFCGSVPNTQPVVEAKTPIANVVGSKKYVVVKGWQGVSHPDRQHRWQTTDVVPVATLGDASL